MHHHEYFSDGDFDVDGAAVVDLPVNKISMTVPPFAKIPKKANEIWNDQVFSDGDTPTPKQRNV